MHQNVITVITKEQRAHDLACAIIANSELTNSLEPANVNGELMEDIIKIYKSLYDVAVDYFDEHNG